MKNTFKPLTYFCFFTFIIFTIIACDKDFSSIDSDVLGEENFNFNGLVKDDYSIIAYNKVLNSVQVNGHTSNLLGVYNDPAYGQTTASIVMQVSPSPTSPTGTNDINFGDNPVLDSVVVTIPYFSTQTEVDNDGNPVYKLDSLYTDETPKPIKLSIYQNTYFLRNFNPNSSINETQSYYSKPDDASTTDNFALTETDEINFDNNKDFKIYEIPEFTPSANIIKTTIGTGDDTQTAIAPPALRINLTKEWDPISKKESSVDSPDKIAFWKSLILDKGGSPELSNVNNFINYFRGIYFKAESINNDGSMILLNLAASTASLTIYYSEDEKQSNFVLNFSGNILNNFTNNYDKVNLQNGDTLSGDPTLYLKGTKGSMGVIKLFDEQNIVECNCGENANGDPIIISTTELDCFKKTFRKTDEEGNELDKVNGQFQLKQLINEAHIIVYEDEVMSTLPKRPNGEDHSQYDRLYMYNLENNTPIPDYSNDISRIDSSPLNSHIFSLGRRIKDEDGIARYKLKVTDHLNNILINDADNAKLGLAIINNVNISTSHKILNEDKNVTGVPSVSTITPRGTILHGSDASSENKKIKLEVFFTEPKK